MSILDDFGDAVSDLWDDGVEAFENLVEMGEEAVEEAGETILEEILGLDDLTSGEGSEGGSSSEGHEEEHEWALQVGNLEDAILTSLQDAQREADISDLMWGDDIQGTVDDIVTEPDANGVFDDVVGSVEDGLVTIEAEETDGVATELHNASATTDSLRFLRQDQGSSTILPGWTDFSSHDPGTTIFELLHYATETLIDRGERQESSLISDSSGSFGTSHATTIGDASPTFSGSFLF